MSTIAIGNVTIDPIHHPAVLNTATWNAAAAWEILEGYPDSCWDEILTGLRDGQLVPPESGELKLFSASLASKGGVDYFLVELPDEQNVILSIAEHSHESPLGTPPAVCSRTWRTVPGKGAHQRWLARVLQGEVLPIHRARAITSRARAP